MDDDGVSRAKAHAPRAADDGLGSNLDEKIYDLPPPTLKAVMTVCPQVRRITLESDKSPEPEWYNGTVGVVKFVENGPALVHAISKRYGNYNAANTESKIVQWPGGATSCQKLDNVCNNDICKQCPLFKQKSNPITLARNAEKAEPPTMIQEVGDEQIEITIPNPPPPYKRGRLGGIQMLMEKDGKEFTVPVLKHDLYPLARQKNRGAQTETQVWRCHLPHDEVHEFTIPAKSFVDNKALQGILADQGVYTDDMPKLRGYMSAYIQELQKQEKPVEQVSHLGWINEYTEFVLSDKILTKDGSKPVSLAPIVQSAGDFLSKRGSLSEQIKLLKFFDHPQYVDRQFFILASLASPLFHCTGEAGIVVNACGKPGASKSTSLDTGAAFWGKPADYVMDGTKGGSTQNARDARRGILCNLPFCLDELTGIEPDEARAMAMGSTQTQPIKKRLHQDGTPRTSEKYERSSIQMITANVSMHGLMATGNRAGTAGAMRVFEINFDIPTVHKTWEHKHYLREVKKNYGHIGPAFMALVVKHADQVEQLVNQEFIRLMKAGSMENGERFWFALGAAVIATAKIAKKWGLSPFDPAAIESWFLHNQIPGLRGVVVADEAANEPATVLGDYIESIGGNMLITRKSGGNLEEFEVIESRASLKGHIDLDKGVGWFVKNEFRSYCDRRGLFAQQILKQLLLSGVVASLERKLTIGAGTKYAKGQTMCFTVDMNHPAISDKTPKPVKKGLTVIQGGKAP